MKKNEIPVLTLGDKKIRAEKPKAILWRRLMEFDRDRAEIPAEQYIQKYCEILAMVFPVTAEEIEETADIDEIYYVYHNVFMWITNLLTSKLSEIPASKKNEQ